MVSSDNELNISIVVYHPDFERLEATLLSLNTSAGYARMCDTVSAVRLYLIDNGDDPVVLGRLHRLLDRPDCSDQLAGIDLIAGHGNPGYGVGHNLALTQSRASYHLILNPDVELAADALYRALCFMQAHPDAGLLAPAATDAKGQPQYLCKRYPTVLDLLLRGFAPGWLRQRMRERLERYEMRELIDSGIVWDVPLVSGCFMLLSRSVLDRVQGFDPDFFLYFEDYDLSLRVGRIARTVYVPEVRIVHHGGHASAKGWRHVQLFVRSAVRFFNRHGWVLC